MNQSTVTVSDGYTLALANDVTKSTTTAAIWTFNGTTAIYKHEAKSAGYAVENNQIVYNLPSGGATVAVSGVKSTEGLSINGTTVLVSNSALDGKTVTVSDGYTLALDSNVMMPTTTSASWSYSNGTATYRSAATSEGYRLEDNQINYIEASGGETFTVAGVKSKDGLSLSGKVVTVANSALNKNAVSISDGYTLALGEDVPISVNTKESWTLKDNVATYTGAATSEGYLLSDNKISYTAASGGEIFTVSGVKSTSGLSINDKVVTVANSALNQAEVTISDGYTLALGDDVTESKNKTGWTKLDNGNTVYQTDTTTAGYKLSDNKISYVAEIQGETLAELSGIDSASTPTIDDSGITFAADNFEDNVAVIQSKTANFNFTAGDYLDKEFSGTDKIDKISNAGSKLIINGNAGGDKINNSGSDVTIAGGAGDDQITLSGGDAGGNTYVYADGDGKDILFNFKANDTIQVMGTASVDANVKNKDVVFTVGKGTITVRDAATLNTAISIVNSAGKAISDNTYTTDGIISGKKIELSETLKKPYTQTEGLSPATARVAQFPAAQVMIP